MTAERDDRLDTIRARADAATDGPWHVLTSRDVFSAVVSDAGLIGMDFERDANVEFVAAARQDVPWLLAEVDRLHADLADRDARAVSAAREVYSTGYWDHGDGIGYDANGAMIKFRAALAGDSEPTP